MKYDERACKFNMDTGCVMWKKTRENQNVIEQTGINQDFGIKDVGHARLMATELSTDSDRGGTWV